MNQSNSLSVHLKRSESIAGWIYLPFYLFFLSLILAFILYIPTFFKLRFI